MHIPRIAKVGLGAEVKLYDTALHRTAVLLWENHAAIEQAFSKQAREIFSLKEKVILYDLTNTYFEGSKRGSKAARQGQSKERRNDCPIITLSLSIDEEGFPMQSKVWEGNVSEPDTLKEQRFEQELLAIKAGLGKTKRQKRYDTIIERIGRLKERYEVGNLYTIKVEQADGKAIDLQFEKMIRHRQRQMLQARDL